jgi:hypothetical protein
LAVVSSCGASAAVCFDAVLARLATLAAALIVYAIPYDLAYPVVKYRHAIEPELLLLSVYLAFVLWGEIRAHAHHKT